MTAERSSAFQKRVSEIVSGKKHFRQKKRKKRETTLNLKLHIKRRSVNAAMILSWQTHHLCNESLVSYIFLSRKVLPLIFESSMLIYLFILRYTIWYFGKEVLTSYLSKVFW